MSNPNNRCPIFEYHQYNYNADSSTVDKSVFTCPCGAEQVEHEDAGTGA